jgi:ABC-2 type transport system ATP-binding protein/lipopolysaccharide transport system ATP-binding protein
MQPTTSIEFRDVSVGYPTHKIPTLKEWVVRNVTRRKSDEYFWALRDVTFEIKRGEALGIIGRNGAGKSTLLRVAAGVIPPTKGEASTRGTIAPLIELGTGFDGELSGIENVFFNGALLGRSRAYMMGRLDEIVDFAGLGSSIDAPLRTYSTGMVARLAFGIATTIDADIVLLDEILAVGDASFREKCDEKIRRFRDSGATIVLVSHDLTAVHELCSRTVWIADGRIRAAGRSDEVIDAYKRSLHLAAPAPLVGSRGRD